MDLKSISFFSSLSREMKWLTERQKVLAQNIANADTPGYIPKDLKKISFKAHLDQANTTPGELQMRTLVKGHMTSDGISSGSNEIQQQDTSFTIASPDGNAVNLEDELIKMSKTQMEYTLAVNLYRKHVTMLKVVLGRR
ncbi:MAG: flagellar basal body rod protein FlgB [Alphaproteobacteria bacterium]|nr:flagellar basal body rod protein FlgB [Alphaproteobacteria bacterium]